MNHFDFFTFNNNLIVTTSLLLIAISLVYIAFKLSEKHKTKHSH